MHKIDRQNIVAKKRNKRRILSKTGMPMDILKLQCFDTAAALYPNDRASLERCRRFLKAAKPSSFEDLQKLFGVRIDLFKPRAGLNWVVIDVGGNNLRVIGGVRYTKAIEVRGVEHIRQPKFYVKHIFTHADYDKANNWYRSNDKGVMR